MSRDYVLDALTKLNRVSMKDGLSGHMFELILDNKEQ